MKVCSFWGLFGGLVVLSVLCRAVQRTDRQTETSFFFHNSACSFHHLAAPRRSGRHSYWLLFLKNNPNRQDGEAEASKYNLTVDSKSFPRLSLTHLFSVAHTHTQTHKLGADFHLWMGRELLSSSIREKGRLLFLYKYALWHQRPCAVLLLLFISISLRRSYFSLDL